MKISTYLIICMFSNALTVIWLDDGWVNSVMFWSTVKNQVFVEERRLYEMATILAM